MEKGLLRRADAPAKRRMLTRSELLADALRAALAKAGQVEPLPLICVPLRNLCSFALYAEEVDQRLRRCTQIRRGLLLSASTL
jgi:hypothetical protein